MPPKIQINWIKIFYKVRTIMEEPEKSWDFIHVCNRSTSF